MFCMSPRLHDDSVHGSIGRVKQVLAISDDELGRQATMCTEKDCLHGGVLYGGSTSIWNKTLTDGVAVGLVNVGAHPFTCRLIVQQ